MSHPHHVTAEETSVEINADPNVEFKEYAFRFNKDELGNKRNTVTLSAVPVPSVQGLLHILKAGGKGLQMLQEVAADVIRTSLKNYVADNEGANESNIPWEKFSWEAIATQPRQERKSIDPALWEGFIKDYLDIMGAVTGKTELQLKNACFIYMKKFSVVKQNKDTIRTLKEQLGLYMQHSQNAEKFSDVLDLLTSKADTLLEANDIEQLTQNL